jgi:hypothetical protein
MTTTHGTAQCSPATMPMSHCSWGGWEILCNSNDNARYVVFEGLVHQTGKKPESNRTEPRSVFFSSYGCLSSCTGSVAVLHIVYVV